MDAHPGFLQEAAAWNFCLDLFGSTFSFSSEFTDKICCNSNLISEKEFPYLVVRIGLTTEPIQILIGLRVLYNSYWNAVDMRKVCCKT